MCTLNRWVKTIRCGTNVGQHEDSAHLVPLWPRNLGDSFRLVMEVDEFVNATATDLLCAPSRELMIDYIDK